MKEKTYSVVADELYMFKTLSSMLSPTLVADFSTFQGQLAMFILPRLKYEQLKELNCEIAKQGYDRVSLLFYRVTEGSSELPEEITSFDNYELDNVKEYRFNGNTEPLLISDYCNTMPPLKDSNVYEHYVAVTLVMKA